ncbi:toxin [Streptomyces collinus]|uniref:toxin n=1 Tax=Streptomyces collinus TaxID=42684 RepID=UPI002941F8E4|nr:toxin [Streptomyces collinus]
MRRLVSAAIDRARTHREMRRLADVLIEPIQVSVPADPDELFEALVLSVSQWRGRQVRVHERSFPTALRATGMWMERRAPEGDIADHIIIEEHAAAWHKFVIFGHEVWHMYKDEAIGPSELAAASRTDFVECAEKEAETFGLMMAQRLRPWLQAAPDSVYAARSGTDHVAGRIGAALNYRGTK